MECVLQEVSTQHHVKCKIFIGTKAEMEILGDECVSGNWTPPMLQVTPAKKKKKTKTQKKVQKTTKPGKKNAKAKKQTKQKQSKKRESGMHVKVII